MMSSIEKLLETFGLSGVAVATIIFVLSCVVAIVVRNPFGIRDLLKKIFHVPEPPGQARPVLDRHWDVKSKERTFKSGDKMAIDHLYFFITNSGKEIAKSHKPEVWIETDGRIVFDNREGLSKLKDLSPINPNKEVGFEMFDLLSTGSHEISNSIRLLGIKTALLDKEFTMHSVSTYRAPDGIREYTTPVYEIRFKWVDKGLLQKDIKVIVVESVERENINQS